MPTDTPTRRVQYPDGSQGGYAATVPDHEDPDRRATAAEMEAARAWASETNGDAEEYDLALAILVHGRKRLDDETLSTASRADASKTIGILNRAEQVAPVPVTQDDATTEAWTRHYAALALAAYAAFGEVFAGPKSGFGPVLGYLSEIAVASTAAAVVLVTPSDEAARMLWDLTPEAGALNGEYEEWLVDTLDRLGINPADLNPDYNAGDFRSPRVAPSAEPSAAATA